jgi:hypothetical protein
MTSAAISPAVATTPVGHCLDARWTPAGAEFQTRTDAGGYRITTSDGIEHGPMTSFEVARRRALKFGFAARRAGHALDVCVRDADGDIVYEHSVPQPR